MAAPTFAPALGLVDAAGVPISASNPLSVSLVAGGGGTAVSIADGADVALGSLADSSSALTVNGLLKAIKALLGAPLAVTGSFYQATQPISGTITANAGTGTFAVSAASLPLPSGAATAAKQPALGTAGTASTDVLSVQGIAGGTALAVTVSNAFALDTSVSGILVAQASTTSGQSGPLTQGAVTTAAPSYTTAKTSPLSLDLAGNLRIVQVSESSSTVGVASSATTVTLLAANTSRKGASIYNASTAILYVQEGGAASIASGGYNVAIPASGYYELPTPVYKGVLNGIWASANGYAQMKENT